MNGGELHDPVALALAEDTGSGDLTAQFFIAADSLSRGVIIAREDCVIAGTKAAVRSFQLIDSTVELVNCVTDGERVTAGDQVLEIRGPTRSLVTSERTALNFLQRLSGVATLTRKFVDAVAATGSQAKILDTRKTTPCLRHFEKAAVVAGGGVNHRMGLYDMAMVKDNHLLAEGKQAQLQNSIDRLRATHPEIRVELEADTLEQVERFLKLRGVGKILLDNMSVQQLGQAVAMGGGQVEFEASGGVTLETVGAIARSGVDFISVGALTHSARAIDLALELVHS